MTLDKFARTILFGTTLGDKLCTPDAFSPDPLVADLPLADIPRFPGRPPTLASPGKARFPPLGLLRDPKSRGEVLHFFANHELLAMELMALMLLRFPEAEREFRIGLAHTILEEQNHLRLYLERMSELGVVFGELPVSDYFWNAMSGVPTKLDFVTQMSLTFEQANLDFSRFFRDEVARVGDAKTAALLDRVYREEIGHVKHGLKWFNRWRGNTDSESDWDAYQRLLPPPMTPRRAKGFGYCIEARREAGFSGTFIRELGLYSGSKGRPPVVWLFNPHCDAEIARGRPGFTPTEGSRRLSADLEHLPMFLALDKDLVLVKKRPRPEWLEALKQSGFDIPELVEEKTPGQNLGERVRAPRVGGVEPWGWSPDTLEAFRPLRTRISLTSGANGAWSERILGLENYQQSGFSDIFSKSWSVDFLKRWLTGNPAAQSVFGSPQLLGAAYPDVASATGRINEILESGSSAMVKACYGTSGMAVRQVRTPADLEGPLGGWIRNTIASQGKIVVEHHLAKECDLSIQLVIQEERSQMLEFRRFVTGAQNEYRGTFLGNKPTGFKPSELRFVHSAFESWREMLRQLGTELRAAGYRGPAGVDALLWRDKDGHLKMKPLVELNPRWTMGRIALELESHFVPGVSGLWAFVPIRELASRGYSGVADFARTLVKKHPLVLTPAGSGFKIKSGVVFTNDPQTAGEALTVLATLPNLELESLLMTQSS